MVVQTINELTKMKLIVRIRRKARDNRRVYVDNHYQLVFYIRGKIKGKKTVRLHLQYNRTNSLEKPSYVHYYDSTDFVDCQDLSEKFFLTRGSPSD